MIFTPIPPSEYLTVFSTVFAAGVAMGLVFMGMPIGSVAKKDKIF